MIAFLRGRVIDKQPNRLIVEVQGVGYDVQVPLSTFYEVGDQGSEIALKIYTHVREEALQLFGFLTDVERQLFERLIAVSGIGPKVAIAVLSGMDPRDLVVAVQRGDVARLTGIPGVGKKTAERIVLELKDRLAGIAAVQVEAASASLEGAERLRVDLVSALQNLGYHRPQADKAVESTLKSTPGTTFEQALKSALRELMQ